MGQKDIFSTTQTSILDAASRVLMKQGSKGFTLDAVAQEATVSKGGLLYHFPSKKQLIQTMLERMVAKVDSTLQEELAKSGGDYVTAYIRASLKTNTEPDRISYALLAAIADTPELLKPLQTHFYKMQEEIAAAAASPEIGTLIRLALDGLWLSDLFGFAPPSPELREKISDVLLLFVEKTI